MRTNFCVESLIRGPWFQLPQDTHTPGNLSHLGDSERQREVTLFFSRTERYHLLSSLGKPFPPPPPASPVARPVPRPLLRRETPLRSTDLMWHLWGISRDQGYLVAQTVKNLPAMQETQVQSLGWDDTLGKGMATRSGILAWRVPWTEEPGRLQSMGSQRVRYD